MNFKNYNLFFHTESSVDQLCFNLRDSPITEKWINTLINAECKDIVDVNMHFEGSKVEIENQLEQLVTLVATEKPEILNFWRKPLTQGIMNSLHQYFHKSVETENFSSQSIKDILCNINPLIHYWESLKEESANWVYYRLDSSYKELISDDLRAYWKIENVPPGSLRLGYHTVGKDLWTCFRDNDIQVVKNGLVRPQLDIHSQVFFRIEELILPYSSDVLLSKFDRWCNMNNTVNYGVHSKDPTHRFGMKPILGTLKDFPSKEKIVSMWKHAKKITWTLE
jgi:hypothetical protein